MVSPDSGPDDPITQPTNRGNKLRIDAKYVHEGALGYSNPREHYKQVFTLYSIARTSSASPLEAFYACFGCDTALLWRVDKNSSSCTDFAGVKQKINHAGYSRYILKRNPPRYDSEGDELDDDDVDEEADAAAAEENPFSDVKIDSAL